jgi:glycosyltransferase involved in cell wall biosynthesis
MNIAFVNATRKWGGVKTWMLESALGLEKLGHSCRIAGRGGPFLETAKEKNIRTMEVDFGPDFNPLAVYRFIRFFRKTDTELVMVNVGKGMRTAGAAAGLLGLPVIHRVGLPGDMRNCLKVRLMYKLIRPRLLAPAEYVKKGILREHEYIDPSRVHVIHTGKTVPRLNDSLARPLRIVSTSQLNPNKGHLEMLDCLEAVFEQGHDFTYTIVGTGPEEEKLRNRADKSPIRDKVFFAGFTNDVSTLLKNADIFLLGSNSEGLPNALLEGMAHGLIPVARDIEPVRDMWPEKHYNLLFDSGESCVKVLSSLLDKDKDELKTMQKEMREHIKKYFCFETQIKVLEKFCLKCTKDYFSEDD